MSFTSPIKKISIKLNEEDQNIVTPSPVTSSTITNSNCEGFNDIDSLTFQDVIFKSRRRIIVDKEKKFTNDQIYAKIKEIR
jgi:hypothetical protein